MSGGGLKPTVEAVWLQWPTPGAPSAAIELNGKSAILRGPQPGSTGDALKSASGDDPRTEAVLSPLDSIENTIHRNKYHEPYYEWRTTDKKDDGNNARRYYTSMVRHQKGGRPDEPKNQGDATVRAALIITVFSVQRGPAQNAECLHLARSFGLRF